MSPYREPGRLTLIERRVRVVRPEPSRLTQHALAAGFALAGVLSASWVASCWGLP